MLTVHLLGKVVYGEKFGLKLPGHKTFSEQLQSLYLPHATYTSVSQLSVGSHDYLTRLLDLLGFKIPAPKGYDIRFIWTPSFGSFGSLCPLLV